MIDFFKPEDFNSFISEYERQLVAHCANVKLEKESKIIYSTDGYYSDSERFKNGWQDVEPDGSMPLAKYRAIRICLEKIEQKKEDKQNDEIKNLKSLIRDSNNILKEYIPYIGADIIAQRLKMITIQMDKVLNET